MRVFISWSGEPSRQIAELLRHWIPSVIQEVQPFVSSQDIAKGSRGMETIGRQLAETDFGIVVLTPDNASAPWVNFEAGALSKSLAHGHVIPLLCGVTEIDLPNSPLRQFQWAQFSKQEMLSLLVSMNGSCDQPLELERLTRAFGVWWPDLEAGYADLPKVEKPEKPRTGNINARVENALEAIMADISALRRETASHSAAIRTLATHSRANSAFGPLASNRAAEKSFLSNWANLKTISDLYNTETNISSDDLAKAILARKSGGTPDAEGEES